MLKVAVVSLATRVWVVLGVASLSALATMDTVVGLKTAKVRLTLSLITNGAEEIALIRFNAGIPFELCKPSRLGLRY
jgi:hypothetical protein